MASNRPLPADLTVTGMDQKSLYQWMANVTDLVNELQADHATVRTAVDDNTTAINAIIAAATTDGATAIAGVTTVTAGVPAALSNSTAITLLRS